MTAASRPVPALLAAALIALLPAGCGGGGDSGDSTARQPSAPQSATETAPNPPDAAIQDRPGGPGRGSGGGEHDGGKEPAGAFPPPKPQPAGTHQAGAAESKAIVQSVDAYISALNRHDGAIVCMLFEPGALSSVRLPKRLGSCATSVTASIGFAAPGGQPRWVSTRLVDTKSVVRVKGGDGRLTGTVVHRFAGSREPSVEDDVIYLKLDGGRWRIVKPSSTFYRAIGVGDVPLSALTPPKG